MLQIEKKRFVGIDTDTDSRLLNVNHYRFALNARIGNTEVDSEGAVENVKGNSLIANALPAGFNKTIGTFEDAKSNRLIIWNWNSNGDHGIYILKNDIITKVISGPFLGFEQNVYIKGIGVVDDLLKYTDGVRPTRAINLVKNYTGITNPTIDLNKPQPTIPLPVLRLYDPALANAQNKISSDSWQITYQYIYEDNEVTPFAPFSFLAKARVKPDQKFFEAGSPYLPYDFNNLNIQLPMSFPEGVKKINLAYKKNNSGPLYIFKTLLVPLEQNEGLNSIIPGAPLNYSFTNTETPIAVADAEAAKLFETIPNAETLAIAENRLFVANIKEGLTIDEKAMRDAGFTVEVISAPSVMSAESLANGEIITKGGDPFSIGLIFHKGNISTGVHFVQNVSPGVFPLSGQPNNTFQHYRVKVTGDIPPGFDGFSIVRTRGSFYRQYMQLPVRVWYYYSDKVEGGLAPPNPPLTSADYTIGDGLYYYLLGAKRYDNFHFLHLQLPKGVPWVPDNNTFVRILTPQGYGNVQRVLDLKGNKVVCSDFGLAAKKAATGVNDFINVNNFFGITDTGGDSNVYNYWRVEFFQYAEATADLFYEVAGPFATGGIDVYLTGTAYAINKGYSFFDRTTPLDEPASEARFQYSFGFEYPAPTMVEAKVDTTLVSKKGNKLDKPYIDYQYDVAKIAASLGRPFVRVENEAELNRSGTLRFSNKYIQASNINGLSTFDALDEYVLPSERSPIRKLVLAKNVLLAIHERETTSLYVGEGFIKQADGTDTLTKTDAVIGSDRIVAGAGNFGTIHPESVLEHDGTVFWFDAYSGAVCRYTLAGIFPISSYGMKAYFRNLGKLYTNVPAKIIGGYDPEFDEYLLTFLAIPGVEAQTWCFNVKTEKWTSRYSFTPECYGKLGNAIYSFENGRCWKHNNSNVYNNFYGVQFPRRIKCLANSVSYKVKGFTNIHIKMDKLCADPTSEFKVAQFRGDEGQYSFTPAYELEKVEGVFRGQIFKSVSELESNPDIRAGDDLKGEVVEVELTTDLTNLAVMRDVNILYYFSEYSN